MKVKDISNEILACLNCCARRHSYEASHNFLIILARFQPAEQLAEERWRLLLWIRKCHETERAYYQGVCGKWELRSLGSYKRTGRRNSRLVADSNSSPFLVVSSCRARAAALRTLSNIPISDSLCPDMARNSLQQRSTVRMGLIDWIADHSRHPLAPASKFYRYL